MRFASPSWLYLLMLVPVVYWVLIEQQKIRRQRFTRFADPAVWEAIAPELDFEARLRKERAWLIAVFFLILALARPQWGKIEETVKATGLDALVVLDVSKSMEAEDVVPSRLKKAKHLIRTISERIQGDRMGVVAFAGSSYLACPLTTDLGYVNESVSIMNPDMIQNQGTDVGIALETAMKALERGGEEAGGPKDRPSASKAVIVLSDGEDHEQGGIDQARKLKESGIRLYVVGIGTEKGGPIPVRDDAGQLHGYKRSRTGDAVVTSFKPDYLMNVAQAGDGKYWTATPAETEVDELVHDLGGLARGEYTERKIVTYQERYQFPLAFAVVFLIQEWSLAARKIIREKRSRRKNAPSEVRGVASTAGPLTIGV